MQKIIISILINIVIAVSGCGETSTAVIEDETPRLVLTADKMTGGAPLTVTFTGTFHGKIDTITMLVPDMIFYSGIGKTIIRYALPDTTQPSKARYSETVTYSGKGSVKAVMLLQGRYKDYRSDSLTITVN